MGLPEVLVIGSCLVVAGLCVAFALISGAAMRERERRDIERDRARRETLVRARQELFRANAVADIVANRPRTAARRMGHSSAVNPFGSDPLRYAPGVYPAPDSAGDPSFFEDLSSPGHCVTHHAQPDCSPTHHDSSSGCDSGSSSYDSGSSYDGGSCGSD